MPPIVGCCATAHPQSPSILLGFVTLIKVIARADTRVKVIARTDTRVEVGARIVVKFGPELSPRL